uniref:Uncharacterized protein n=1 Tax=Arundo donax TaxID=35708 RepID=A0A0A8Y872_ARUDO
MSAPPTRDYQIASFPQRNSDLLLSPLVQICHGMLSLGPAQILA